LPQLDFCCPKTVGQRLGHCPTCDAGCPRRVAARCPDARNAPPANSVKFLGPIALLLPSLIHSRLLLRTAAFVPAARLRPGCFICSSPPRYEGERSADRRWGCLRGTPGVPNCVARQALARRLASLAIGTLASRRSTLAILGRGRASISAISCGSVQRAPRSRVLVPGGRGPEPPEPMVASHSRGTPIPAPPSGSPPVGAPQKRGWTIIWHSSCERSIFVSNM
jgi:hypothetical protein